MGGEGWPARVDETDGRGDHGRVQRAVRRPAAVARLSTDTSNCNGLAHHRARAARRAGCSEFADALPAEIVEEYAQALSDALYAGEPASTADAIVRDVPLRTTGLLAAWKEGLSEYPPDDMEWKPIKLGKPRVTGGYPGIFGTAPGRGPQSRRERSTTTGGPSSRGRLGTRRA